MRLNESERKQRPFTPSQKTMALLLEALGRITWAEIVNGVSAICQQGYTSTVTRICRSIMYLQHEVVELHLGELSFFMAGPRVFSKHAAVFDAISIFAIAARVGDGARRTQQVDQQLGIGAVGSLCRVKWEVKEEGKWYSLPSGAPEVL